MSNKILIVGAGSTGSHVAHRLAMYCAAYRDHVQSVTIHDIAEIRPANMIRQIHNYNSIGENKALALAANLANFYMVPFKSLSALHRPDFEKYQIVFICVDDYDYRMNLEIQDNFIIDCGNADTYGQVISGYARSSKMFKDWNIPRMPANTPSCTLQEALEKQSLFINTIVADVAIGHLLKHLSNKNAPGQVSWIDFDSITIKTHNNVSRSEQSI